MTKWEYLPMYIKTNGAQKQLNDLGRQGWELAAISQTNVYIFKRPIWGY